MPVSIAIVDDHDCVIEGVIGIISKNTNYRVVATVKEGKKLLPILNSHPVDLILLDLKMPDISGIDLARTIRLRFPEIKIIVFTTYEEPKIIQAIKEIGVEGYLSKSSGAGEMIQAFQKVIRGDFVFPKGKKEEPSILNNDSFSSKFKLTKREKEITMLIGTGMATKDIAARLFLSESTVETHRKSIKHKIGFSDPFNVKVFLLENDI